MEKKTRILAFFPILFFIFILITNTVNSFYVEENILTNSVCPSSTIVIKERIISDRSSNFEISLSGSASYFSVALPSSFVLNEGENKTVYIYITPNSYVVPGIYSLRVDISNGYEIKNYSYDIFVENCNNLSIELEKDTPKEVCGCEKVVYNGKIKNSGNYYERYFLRVEGEAKSFSELSLNRVSLAPGEEKNFIVSFLPPCNLNEGNYSFALTATSLDSRAMKTVTNSVIVKNCFGYRLSIEKNFYEVCDGDRVNATLYIENLGKESNVYEINSKGANFFNLVKDKIEVNSKSKGKVEILINPKYGEKEGKYITEIETLSEKGKILGKENISVLVKECHKTSIDLEVSGKKEKICNSLTNTYGISLKNLGLKKGEYEIKLNGPEWIKISKDKVVLNPNENASLWLEVSPPYDTKPDLYKIEVTARDINSETIAKDNFNLETLTIEECYKPKINVEKEKIEIEKDKTGVLIFNIENSGARKAKYLIDLSGSANAFTYYNPKIIELNPGKAENVYVYIAPKTTTKEGDYVLTLSARLNDTTILSSKTVNIKILETRTIIKENVSVVPKKEESKSFIEKVKEWIKNLIIKIKEITSKKKENVSVLKKENETERTQKQIKQQEESVENTTNKSNYKENSSDKTKINKKNTSNETGKNEETEKLKGKLTGNKSNENKSSNETKKEVKEVIKSLLYEKNMPKTSAKEMLVKYRWWIVSFLIVVAAIIVLSIFDVWDRFFKLKK